jgi:hypothetical protein
MDWNDSYRASKSLSYRTCHLPGYDQNEELCHEDPRMTKTQLSQAENWNTFQQKTWYQTYLNKLDRGDCPIGVQGEFRTPGLAETKVSLMETGKWRTFQESQRHPSEMNNTSNHLLDEEEDFYAPEVMTTTTDPTDFAQTSFRPHSTQGGNRPSKYFDGTKKDSLFHETKTPPINPKTMFLPKNQVPLFGTLKTTQHFNATSTTTANYPNSPSPHSSNRPQTSASNPSHSRSNTRNQNMTSSSGGGTQNLDRISAAAAAAYASDLSSSSRPMSSQALSRRHMGVSINPIQTKSGTGISTTSSAYHSKINTLKETNRLNHLTSPGHSHTSLILDRTSRPIHPQSGYDRGLKGTLLIDEWRGDELMKSDGKICYHPLSYDVLETLTYGPPDPAQKLSHDQHFVSHPHLSLCLSHTLLAAFSASSTINPHSKNLLLSCKSIVVLLILNTSDNHCSTIPSIL